MHLEKNMQNEKVHFQVGNFLNQLSMQSKIEILIRWHAMASHSLQLYFSQEIFGAPKIAAIFENAFFCDSMFVNVVLYGPDHLIKIIFMQSQLAPTTSWNAVSPSITVLFQYLIYSVNCTLI